MALIKPFLLSPFIFLFFLVLFSIGHAKREMPRHKKPSSFEFIKELKGCHKGDNIKGIHHLKNYLREFGYLEYLNKTHADDDDFDDVLVSGVKTYQQNYHINPTGMLDDTTISRMITPRCGVPDIINGTNTMRPKKHSASPKSIHSVSHYTFFQGSPRWPSSKTHLTYRFSPNTPTAAIPSVVRAFQKWDSATHFTFSRVSTNQNADLVIGFYRGDHGDGFPFDGPGGTLAHAFPPTNGRFHYDANEQWSVGPVANAFDLETIAIHEIGHLLGLGHSSVPEAIMFPSIPAGTVKNLHEDDITGIRVLYGV